MRRKPIHKLQREIDDLDVNLDALDSEVDTKTQIDNSAAESVDDTYSASKIEELIAAIPSGGEVEGTSVLSTGETGGTKFLREDGDGTCSWQTPAGGSPTVATGAEVDTGTDNTKMVTPKAMEDSSYSKLALGETSATAYRGDRGKTAYGHSQAAHAPEDADNTATVCDASGNVTALSNDAKIANIDGGALQHIRYEDLYNQMRDELKNYFDSIYTPL